MADSWVGRSGKRICLVHSTKRSSRLLGVLEYCTYVDFKQVLVALNNVRSFLRLRNMFVYVAPDGYHVNSKSSFEL